VSSRGLALDDFLGLDREVGDHLRVDGHVDEALKGDLVQGSARGGRHDGDVCKSYVPQRMLVVWTFDED